MRFVLDCSVAISWCLQDEDSIYANAVLTLLSSQNQAVIPNIWWLEIVNVLLVAERRQRSTSVQSDQAIRMLQSLPILIDTASMQETLDSTLKFGRDHNLAAYDAAYLELAVREQLLLATLDQKLVTVAQRLGIFLGGFSDGR
jgi:predicted nucleic acid-binding protein